MIAKTGSLKSMTERALKEPLKHSLEEVRPDFLSDKKQKNEIIRGLMGKRHKATSKEISPFFLSFFLFRQALRFTSLRDTMTSSQYQLIRFFGKAQAQCNTAFITIEHVKLNK